MRLATFARLARLSLLSPSPSPVQNPSLPSLSSHPLFSKPFLLRNWFTPVGPLLPGELLPSNADKNLQNPSFSLTSCSVQFPSVHISSLLYPPCGLPFFGQPTPPSVRFPIAVPPSSVQSYWSVQSHWFVQSYSSVQHVPPKQSPSVQSPVPPESPSSSSLPSPPVHSISVQSPPVRPSSVQSSSVQSPYTQLSFWEELQTWPNLISAARLLSGPPLAVAVLQGHIGPALGGLLIAAFSDWLDGYLARRSGQSSVLGSYLDPLADKVLVGCVALALLIRGRLPMWLVLLMVARDGLLLLGAAVLQRKVLINKTAPSEFMQPLFVSKLNTVLQLGLMGAALFEEVGGENIPNWLLPSLCYATATSTCVSGTAYALTFWKKAKIRSKYKSQTCSKI